jgi:hypothetical protein
MFQFRRTNRLQAARCFNPRTQLIWVALALVLLWAAAAPSSASRSTASSLLPAQTPTVPQTTPALPEVVMDLTRRDFGDVFAGEELEQAFAVRNAGTKALELAEKSSLGMRTVAPRYPVTAAVWHTSDHLLARSVAAILPAPS